MAVVVRQEFVVSSDLVDFSSSLFLDKLIDKLQIANFVSSNKIGLTDDFLDGENVSWMLLNDHLVFSKALPKHLDKIIIETVPTNLKGVKFYREDFVYINSVSPENLIAHNGSVWILVDKSTHMPKRPSQLIDKKDLLEKSDTSKTFAMEIEDLKPLDSKDQAEKIFTHKVSYSDLDYNKHMHNTNYLKLAIDAIAFELGLDPNKNSLKINELNIKYLREVFLGDEISIFLVKKGKDFLVEGRTSDKDVSFIVRAGVDLV